MHTYFIFVYGKLFDVTFSSHNLTSRPGGKSTTRGGPILEKGKAPTTRNDPTSEKIKARLLKITVSPAIFDNANDQNKSRLSTYVCACVNLVSEIFFGVV